MELLQPQGAAVLASYEHPAWNPYAAVTENTYGKGSAVYVGCKTTDEMMTRILRYCAEKAGIPAEEIAYPVIVRKGKNQYGREICYYLNYSSEIQKIALHPAGTELLGGTELRENEPVELEPWGVAVLEYD